MPWTRVNEPHKQRIDEFTKDDRSRWEEILRLSREKIEPRCRGEVDEIFDLLVKDKGFRQYNNGPLWVGLLFIDKTQTPGHTAGMWRLLGFSTNGDDLDELGRVLVRGIVDFLVETRARGVYFYTDDVMQRNGDGKIFHKIVQLVEQAAPDRLNIEWFGDGRFVYWKFFLKAQPDVARR